MSRHENEAHRAGTIGEALDDLEAGLFVDREQELTTFAAWLEADDAPPVLNVIGRGGMGKTTLLGAFRRDRARSRS